MIYSTYIFLLVFLPLVLSIYFLLAKANNNIYQKVFLLVASLFFYGFYNPVYLVIIIVSIVVNYVTACIIQNNNSKLALIIGIAFNVLLLGYFKYYDFFVSSINAIFGSTIVLKNIVLPLGISFFTFQQLSFLISIWKKEEIVEDILSYSLFVTFFPQLVAGPIVLYSEMIPQFKDSKKRYFSLSNFNQGLYSFAIGLFKKAVIADTVALFVDNGFAQEALGLSASWVTALSYTLQIYFDFSGYSDMAIGLGKMFNIDITENFSSPYKSRTMSEFWRRWHMTLGRALGTYVYKPLGGNRKGTIRTYANLIITFLISGLWHGASWTFVVWGLLHGLCCVFDRVFSKSIGRVPSIVKQIVTYLVVTLLWILFRAETFSEASKVYRGMVNFSNIDILQLQDIAFDGLVNLPAVVDVAYIIVILISLTTVVLIARGSDELRAKFEFNTRTSVITGCLLIVSLIFMSRESVFIYFNF